MFRGSPWNTPQQSGQRNLGTGKQLSHPFWDRYLRGTDRIQIRIHILRLEGRLAGEIDALLCHIPLAAHIIVPEIVGKTYLMGLLGKPLVGVVLPQQDPVLRPRSEHPVRLVHTFCYQIVDEDSYICFVAAQDERLLPRKGKMGIYARHQSLRGRLLIARSAVDLPCEIKPLYDFRLECGLELQGVEIVILDGISRTEYLDIGESLYGAEGLHLHIERQRRGETLKIILICIPPLRLDEELMGVAAGEGMELVLDRRTVTRPDSLDAARKERRLVEPALEDRMNLFVGMRYIALLLDSAALHRGEQRKI